MADSNLCVLAAQRETSWGVPATPIALKKLRFTRESLEHEKITVKSNEIRDDRQTSESVEVGVGAKGGFEFELSVGDFDQFLESALMGTFDGTGLLKNGVTKTSYLLEKKLLAGSFVSFKGMMLDQFNLALASRQIVTGSMSFIGTKGVEAAASIDSTAGYDAQGSGLILSASANVGNIQIGGTPYTSLKGLDLSISNNLRGSDVIGKKEIDEVGLGSISVTGKINAYFKSRELLTAFFEHTAVGIQFTLSREAPGAVVGDTIGYTFNIPKVTFPKGMPTIPGKDADVMLPIEFDAEVGASGYTISIQKVLKA